MKRGEKYWADQVAELKRFEQLSASGIEELSKVAKSHGTSMTVLIDKLIADFIAKPKRDQERIMEE